MNDQTHITISRIITNNEVILVAVGYTAIFLMLMLVLSTYLLAYRTSVPKSKSLLGLVIFFAAVQINVAYNAIITWLYLSDHSLTLPRWTQWRVATLFLATCFVLYTAWRRDTPIKVVEVDPDKDGPKNRVTDL